MPTELRIHATHEGGLRMTAANTRFSVTTDYPTTPAGQPAGFTPMELLLASLASCTGSVVASLLRRQNQQVAGVEVEARGQRRDAHPTIFTSISLEFVVRGRGVQPGAVEKAIAQADRLCPVWAMLKGTPVTTAFTIVDAEEPVTA